MKTASDLCSPVRFPWLFIILSSVCMSLVGCASVNQFPFPTNPTSAHDYFARGVYYQVHSEYEKAAAEYTQALALDPRLPEAFASRGVCLVADPNGDLDLAIADLTQAIALQPKEIDHYLSRFNAYNMKDDVPHALADCDAAIALPTKNSMFDKYSFCKLKADLLFNDQRFAQAIPAYRTCLEKMSGGGEIGLAVKSAFVTGGSVTILLDPVIAIQAVRREAQGREAYKKEMTWQIDLCESVLRARSAGAGQRAIATGTSRHDVLVTVLATDRIVSEPVTPWSFECGDTYYTQASNQSDVLVTLSAAGTVDKTLNVFVFKDDRLVAQKRIPLHEALDVPGTLQEAGGLFTWSKVGKDPVREEIRKTDNIIYEDDRCIVSIAQWRKVKGKRVRWFYFIDGKCTTTWMGARNLK